MANPNLDFVSGVLPAAAAAPDGLASEGPTRSATVAKRLCTSGRPVVNMCECDDELCTAMAPAAAAFLARGRAGVTVSLCCGHARVPGTRG